MCTPTLPLGTGFYSAHARSNPGLGPERSGWLRTGFFVPWRAVRRLRPAECGIERAPKALRTRYAHALSSGAVAALAELNSNVPAMRRDPFADNDEDPQAQQVLASARSFGCKVRDLLKARLDQLAKSLERIERVATAPTSSFNFRTSGPKTSAPSYALAASKHAPQQNTAPRPLGFKPVQVRKTPPAPPAAIKSLNTFTLVQSTKDGKALASENYPTLITTINQKLADLKNKVSPSGEKTISIRSVHRHPSNDLVLYTTTSAQADALKAQHEAWIPTILDGLELHNPVHTIVVHGIPTSFNPSDSRHLEMLGAMNPDTLNPPPTFC